MQNHLLHHQHSRAQSSQVWAPKWLKLDGTDDKGRHGHQVVSEKTGITVGARWRHVSMQRLREYRSTPSTSIWRFLKMGVPLAIIPFYLRIFHEVNHPFLVVPHIYIYIWNHPSWWDITWSSPRQVSAPSLPAGEYIYIYISSTKWSIEVCWRKGGSWSNGHGWSLGTSKSAMDLQWHMVNSATKSLGKEWHCRDNDDGHQEWDPTNDNG